MEEIYKKVYIKSKADLPEKSGTYIVFVKDDDEINQWSYRKDSPNDDDKDWIEYIDWWFQPVKDITDEEIEMYFPTLRENVLVTRNNNLRQEGAKWMKNKMKSQ
jgi:hypothetical protein